MKIEYYLSTLVAMDCKRPIPVVTVRDGEEARYFEIPEELVAKVRESEFRGYEPEQMAFAIDDKFVSIQFCEGNYNMVDNVLNNGVEKKEQERVAGRISIREKLAEKKAAMEHKDKTVQKDQDRKTQREM